MKGTRHNLNVLRPSTSLFKFKSCRFIRFGGGGGGGRGSTYTSSLADVNFVHMVGDPASN